MSTRIVPLVLTLLLGTVCVPATLAAEAEPGKEQAGAPKQQLKWVGCGISKRGFMQDLAAAYEKKSGIKIALEGGGAARGLRHVAAGQSDLGGSCRLPLIYRKRPGGWSIEKREQNIKLIPVGWDALVALVHPDNPLESITREQLADVLTGRITNWKQLGASEARPINLYIRRGKVSGVGRTLRQQLFDDVEKEFASHDHVIVLKSSGKIEKALQKDPDGLAVSGISSSRHRKLKILQLDGVYPTMDTLKAGDYTLYRILFLVAPRDYEKRPELKGFVDFALSLEGQKVIQAAGTLPYHKGIGLLYKATGSDYIREMEVVDQQGLYTLGGH